jgi:uncharacterized protein YjbJ (UPF0337 family)
VATVSAELVAAADPEARWGTCFGNRPFRAPVEYPEHNPVEVLMGDRTDDLKGTAKEKVGQLTDDRDLEAEGKRDKAKGDVKGGVDKAADAVKDGVDKITP